MRKFIYTLLLCNFCFPLLGQRAKQGNGSITATTVVNSYTAVTADVAVGANSVTVASNALTGGAFGATALAQGDLILIIQAQGASMNIASGLFSYSPEYVADWGNVNAPPLYGRILALNNAGNFEKAEVLSVSGTTSITFTCPLTKAYTAAGKVQIVRIPRYNDLAIAAAGKIEATAWNGTVGGIVALEVLGNLSMTSGSKISVNAQGFRGGEVNTTGTGSGNSNPAGSITYYGTNDVGYGAKGEGIGGFIAEYTALTALRGRGAPANGGGGGSAHNAGGGGGSNVGDIPRTGNGNPTGYAINYDLEYVGFSSSVSSGGGRGGYSLCTLNANENTVGPANTSWGSDNRRIEGGLGGHIIPYTTDRVYFGGGGGSADANNNSTSTVSAGNGGKGGGIILLTVFGNITGTGIVESNGANGSNCQGVTATPFNTKTGSDGAGGAGAGGSVIFTNSNPVPTSITVNTNGGNGGSQFYSFFGGTANEAAGPGAGGGGGLVALNSGSPIQTATGGVNGVTNSSLVNNFPPNGATNGGAGLVNQTISDAYNLTPTNASICANQTANVSVTLTGNAPIGGTISWYTVAFGGSSIATGLTFTTPVLNATTTYYVGYCPGNFRIPVVVTVNAIPVVTGPPTITNVSCTGVLGTISGLTVSGGVSPYTYAWTNGGGTSLDVLNANAGSYSLVVSSSGGCPAASVGPFSVGTNNPPVINASAIVLTNQDCLGVVGSITGITATGAGLTYAWDGASTLSIDLSPATVGNHNLVVSSSNGCTASAGPYSILAIGGPSIDATMVATTNVLCNGTQGSITGITASGAGLTYSWNGVSSLGPNTSGVAAGNYTLTVTNSIGCTSTAGPYLIGTAPNPTINSAAVSIINTNCNINSGAISGLLASGNGLSYAWTNTAQTTVDISGVPNGNYTLTVTDVNGCTAVAGPFSVISSTVGVNISGAALVVTNSACNANTGSIVGLVVTGANAPYTYLWNTGQTTLDIFNLAPGSYGVSFTDAFGCPAGSVTGNIVATTGGPVLSSGSVTITNAICTSSTGSITGISATSGVGLTYSWSGSLQTTLDLINVPSGSYTLTATDMNGCSVNIGPFTLNAAAVGATLDLSGYVITSSSCTANTGSITGISITGPSAPFIYLWSNGATTLDVFNLPPGTYNLTYTDSYGCVTGSSNGYVVSAANGPALAISTQTISGATCNLANGSILNTNATGGLAPYIYSWNTIPTTINANLQNVAAGNYTLTVTDANGCSVTGIYTVPNIPIFTIDTTNLLISNSDCFNLGGSITGITTSGSTSYTYAWSNTAQTVLNPSNLSAGIYDLTVTDAIGCVKTINGIVIESNANSLNAEFSFAPTDIGVDELVQFTDNSLGNIVVWDWSIDSLTFNSENPTYSFDTEGVYPVTLMIQNNLGCIDSITVSVEIITNIMIPNIFTANFDGINDVWVITGLKPETKVVLINRWGQVVFESNNYKNDWRGLDASGEKTVDGVYTYLVTTIKGEEYIGFLQLISNK